MPKTLRRPMFRGGPVNSEGTGITTGLDQGYAQGGRVGYADGPDMFGVQDDTFNYSKDTGLGRFMPKFNEYAFREPLAAAYNLVGVPLNKATEFVTGYNPGFSGERLFNLDMKNRKPDTAEFFGIDTSAKPGFTYRNEQIQNQAKVESEAEKQAKLYSQQIEDLKKAHEAELAKLKGTETGTAVSGESDVSQWAKEARDLLGYEDAKKQSIYDALLAASPGFFKGRNLKEAAPNVFESINKSGAFDKPTNIKQAAAQLAIQRKMLQEKAIAEEKTRYGIMEAKEGYKSKNPLERLKSYGIDPNLSFEGPLPDRKLWESGKIYIDSNGKLVKAKKNETTKIINLIPLDYS
jgi:hypothetical protein